MSMTRKTITVTEQQNAYIKSRIAEGGFTNDSEFVRDLIRKDQEKANKIAHLQKLITEGIESGTSDKTVEDIMLAVEARLRANGNL